MGTPVMFTTMPTFVFGLVWCGGSLPLFPVPVGRSPDTTVNTAATTKSPSEGSLFATLLSLAEGCNCITQLRRVYARLVRHHHQLQSPSLVLAKLLRFAAVSPRGDLRYAVRLFSHHLHHAEVHRGSAFFYNTLIRGYAASVDPPRAISLFKAMRRRSVAPDQFSFTFLLKARSRCSSSSSSSSTPQAATGALVDTKGGWGGCDVHAQALKFGCLAPLAIHVHVHNALVHLYASEGDPDAALRVFEEMPAPDVVSWSGLLTARLWSGDMDAARCVFDGMAERDVVSWTAMISGYVQAGRPAEALGLFRLMPPDLPPDEVTMVSVVSACTALGDLQTGASVHRYAEGSGFGWMVSLRNALIDMYAKCGCLETAREVFDGMERKTLVSWNSMISAYAAHGDDEAALGLFRRMTEEVAGGEVIRVKPDGATFLAVLSACAHRGRVEEGRSLLEEGMRRWEVEPTVEHYGCVVDMLGRAGRLEEAYQLIVGGAMPVPCNHAVWGAVLGACRIHGDVEMGEQVVAELMRLQPGEGGYYLLLAGIYAAAGRQEEAARIRRVMKERGARKNPGRSSLSV